MVFSIPFPNGNSFCNLFIRWSLGLRIEFALFLSGAGDFDPTQSEGERVFLRRPFLLYSSLKKILRRIIEIWYSFL